MQPNPAGCYYLRPHFYEAVGLNVSYNLSSDPNPPQCRWEERKIGLTMEAVWGLTMEEASVWAQYQGVRPLFVLRLLVISAYLAKIG